jgi:hypothetical protein
MEERRNQMKVELSIKDDSELRNVITDMIRGSVTNIIREELHQMAAQQLSKEVAKSIEYLGRTKINDFYNKNDISKFFRDHIKSMVSDEYENNIYLRALSMLQRDNKAIEEIVDRKLSGMKLTIG